jgi:hypothetical protein
LAKPIALKRTVPVIWLLLLKDIVHRKKQVVDKGGNKNKNLAAVALV